ncbi:hypothetical protein ACK8HY_06290 [Sphingobacterium sp. NGMCC 1.201703]|uniref:hypothetical protein n=1 Tax=Sphingobacterium sp. NGMCC 1.201703 TaxID=3388657 RepID=UPI0039FC33C9
METHNATIDRKELSATLRLALGETVLDIVLTEDRPNDVKSVFNKLLEQLKKGEFEFNLTDDKEDLYHHICKEYITQLNAELKSTYSELQDNGLIQLNDKDCA